MPDDRPLSKDLQPGMRLRHRAGDVVTLLDRCELQTAWHEKEQLGSHVFDIEVDAHDSPWSILPSDEPPAEQWLWESKAVRQPGGGRIGGRCAACGQPGHRYGTTDPEHDYVVTACVNGLLGLIDELEATRTTEHEGRPGGSVEGEPPVDTAEIREWIRGGMTAGTFGERRVTGLLKAYEAAEARISRLEALIAVHGAMGRHLEAHGCAWPEHCDAATSHLSRLEAVAEAARAQHYEREHRPGYCRCGAGDECPIFHSLDALDTSVVVPDADGGKS